MGFIRKDLGRLDIFEAVLIQDSEGSVTRTFAEAKGSFKGNIQPFKGGFVPFRLMSNKKEYGIELNYSIVIFTDNGIGLKEGDAVGRGHFEYEIKVVQSWKEHTLLYCDKI